MWQHLFAVTNAIALVGWAALLLGPVRWAPAVRIVGVGLLCLVYVALFALLSGGALDPVGAAPAPAFDYSVRGLRALFASDGGIVVGWTHYLALDLFTGTWIAERAAARGWGRAARAPVLLLTFLAGPAGLLVWLVAEPLRPIRSGRGSYHRPR